MAFNMQLDSAQQQLASFNMVDTVDPALLSATEELIQDVSAAGWSLRAADAELGRFREDKGLSVTKLKNLLNLLGCCLKTGELFGSKTKLRNHLRRCKQDRVSPKQAKPYKNIRHLLVEVFHQRAAAAA